MTVDPNQGRRPPPRTDAEHWERLSPRELALGTHLDVHGLRKDIREAIEKSQTALMNRLSLLEAKIDKLAPAPGADPVDTSKLEAALPAGAAATAELDKEVNQP